MRQATQLELEAPEPKLVMCHRTREWLTRKGKDPTGACGYVWEYCGTNRSIATCPQCNTSVTIWRSDEKLAQLAAREQVRKDQVRLSGMPRVMAVAAHA